MGELPLYRIGADENGLGPRLGPLIVTAVLAEVSEAGHKLVSRPARGKLAELLGDSKALVSHGDVALGEAWARRLIARTDRTRDPVESIDDLVRGISIDAYGVLQRACPKSTRDQCWSTKGEAFEASDETLEAVDNALDTLEKKGVRILRVHSAIVCTNALNEAVRRGVSRFHVDLHAMERLILEMRGSVPSDLLAVCGKVGGIGKYQRAFGPLGGRLSSVVLEKRHHSAYYFPGIGELRFLVDADASDRLVGLSSLVGKWMREVLMARITRHYRSIDENLPEASGYHDPVTEHFVEATRLHRKRRAVPSDCFERNALGTAADRSSNA